MDRRFHHGFLPVLPDSSVSPSKCLSRVYSPLLANWIEIKGLGGALRKHAEKWSDRNSLGHKKLDK
jgi:hypothetical protein